MIKNSSRGDIPSRINPRSSRFVSGKANESRWRPRRYQADPWSRGREVARGVLRFLPSEKDREILSSVFYTPAAKCFCIRRLADTRYVSLAVLWTLWPEGGSQPLVLSNGVCRGLGIPPLRINHVAEFFSGLSWPKIWPGIYIYIFLFFSKCETFLWRFVLIASGTEILWRASLIFYFFGNIAFPLASVWAVGCFSNQTAMSTCVLFILV